MLKYKSIINDLLSFEIVRDMANYNQHGKVNTLMHGLNVSYTVYKICLRLKLEPYDMVRAAFLHDFYLYDWHKEKSVIKHALHHPKEAVKNIEKYHLPVNERQKEMILCHMFPLSPVPRSAGGWILTRSDKYCTCMESFGCSKMMCKKTHANGGKHEDCI